MQAAVLARTDAPVSVDPERVRDILLLRIACGMRGIARPELMSDLAGIVGHRLSSGQWRAMLENGISHLVSSGLAVERSGRIEATEAGTEKAAKFLGLKGNLPRLWNDLRDTRLVARALNLQREPAKRLKTLATADGLRMAIVQSAYGLKIKGIPTASRLRSALANVALERAFGNQIKSGLAGKAGFSPSAGRLLAGQLARQPRDFGTDARLIAALAGEHVGATRSDLAALRLGVLRKFVDGTCVPEAAPRPAPARVKEPAPVAVVAPVERPAGKPDVAGFVSEVRRQAAGQAQGWAGNRRAYISHVWRQIRDQRPEWGVSEIEFKCMLAEAHRAGHVSLAHADLKDSKNIKDIQESAVVFKNAVFHYIQVDA